MFKLNLSIKKFTLLIFIIMYIGFFALSAINLFSYSQYEYNKTENVIKNSNDALTAQIDQKVDSIINTSMHPLILPDQSALIKALTSEDEQYTVDQYDYLFKLCQMMLMQNKTVSVSGVYIYNLNGKGVYALRNNTKETIKNPSEDEWFKKAINDAAPIQVFPEFSAENLLASPSSSEPIIAVSRKISNFNTQDLLGIVVLTFSTDEISSVLKSDYNYDNQEISIVQKNGTLLTSSLSDNTESSLSSYDDFLSADSETPELVYTKDKEDEVVCYNYISSLDCILVNAIPKDAVYRIDSFYLMFFISNILFAFILFAILYNFFLSRVFNPVESLIDNMSGEVEDNIDGDLIVDYKYTSNPNDEVGILINSYNDMKSRINTLITINYKNKIEQKELEFKQLQNQINPHFIYNTLESIHMMAEINDDPETSTMAEYFGSVIRYSMSRGVNLVALKEEISIIKQYIYLQQIRFSTFSIEILADDNVLECEIIKMIIQPLLENAIYHGLKECDGNGKIVVKAYKENSLLIIKVTDNGVGINPEKLALLTGYINDKNQCFDSIGLRNINKRLKLNYGDQYGLTITSRLGEFTCMKLTLPYILRKKNNDKKDS